MMISKRSMFAVEDDGLMKELVFSDNETDENSSDDLASTAVYTSSPVKGESSPNERVLDSSVSDEDRLNSSSDSLMSSVIRRPVLKQRQQTVPSNVDTTPPYRKVRALRLFGSPQSPKTLLKRSEESTAECNRTKTRLFAVDRNQNLLVRNSPATFLSPQLEANINPFYKSDLLPTSLGKRRRDSGLNEASFNESLEKCDNELENEIQPTKRIHLRDNEKGLSRYHKEFLELDEIGSGMFGSVYKCINRLDGCVYAIKKSRNPLKGTADERRAVKEVYAHAVLGQYKHVVRYYSAWAENGCMLIQNEYCNGGSLAQAIEEKTKLNMRFPETEVIHMVLHVAQGLRYIHSLNLAHLDIKPGNIFIEKNLRYDPDSPNSSDDGFVEDDFEDALIYKIGDLGHVISLSEPLDSVEEGDCRYMAPELLAEDYKCLQKADIFALGLTIYEMCSGLPLKGNGEEWQDIRKGHLPYLPYYTKELNELIKEMIKPDPEQRPSSAALVHNHTLVPYALKTKEQLNIELTFEKYKNQLLSKKLQEATQSNNSRLKRVIGGKVNRSSSVTNF